MSSTGDGWQGSFRVCTRAGLGVCARGLGEGRVGPGPVEALSLCHHRPREEASPATAHRLGPCSADVPSLWASTSWGQTRELGCRPGCVEPGRLTWEEPRLGRHPSPSCGAPGRPLLSARASLSQSPWAPWDGGWCRSGCAGVFRPRLQRAGGWGDPSLLLESGADWEAGLLGLEPGRWERTPATSWLWTPCLALRVISSAHDRGAVAGLEADQAAAPQERGGDPELGGAAGSWRASASCPRDAVPEVQSYRHHSHAAHCALGARGRAGSGKPS